SGWGSGLLRPWVARKRSPTCGWVQDNSVAARGFDVGKMIGKPNAVGVFDHTVFNTGANPFTRGYKFLI
ncbi:hypothetical protein, partial [Thiocapsa imhoffii]|uniref:hypothetical protein n=1 Tax=Thiocapsa imhoffii TaxID=382777 RepID=UPI001A90E14A